MKLKLSVLATALVLGSASAQAAITSGASGPSELILSFYDAGTKQSAAFDLGVTVDKFLTGGSFYTGTYSWNLLTGANTVGVTTSYSNVLSSFLTTSTGTKTFSVIGLNDAATTYVSTSTSLTTPLTQNDTKLNNFGQMEAYITGLNGTAGISGAANGAALVASSGGDANFNSVNATKWKNNSGFTTNGALTSTLSFWSETGTGNTYSAASQLGNFSFNANTGVLTYVAAAVPEPSEYALMVAGLLVMGGIARRRKQA